MSQPGAIEGSTRHDRRPAANPIAAPPTEPPRDEPTQHAAARSAGTESPARSLEQFFIPDLCAARAVLAVVLIAELLAVTLSLARPSAAFLTELARISMFLQWLGLTSAAVLCYARPFLARFSIPRATVLAFALLMANTALISEAALFFGGSLGAEGAAAGLFPRDHWSFLLRNEGICVIVTALLLRYFFVAHQWQQHVRTEARSRIEALQARIRPHFLFNSLNTIAALTRSNAARAEEAVEDLADLFRATLRDSHSPLRLKEELELSRIYQRIEELRLGERLKVRWNVAELPMRAFVPGLTVQPLLENAIYHGIEPLEHGGTVTVTGRVSNGRIEIVVANPVAPPRSDAVEHAGNRLALENIRQRLELAYGAEGAIEVEQPAGEYRVTIRFPYEE
jgi:two-component system, LytTR family, sensor histidine kinase AlgZ